jgi:chromosome segregation ATPase
VSKLIKSQIVELERELTNLEQAYREADDEWRSVDVEYVRLKRQREELDALKRDLAYEIEWRIRELAALEEANRHAATA